MTKFADAQLFVSLRRQQKSSNLEEVDKDRHVLDLNEAIEASKIRHNLKRKRKKSEGGTPEAASGSNPVFPKCPWGELSAKKGIQSFSQLMLEEERNNNVDFATIMNEETEKSENLKQIQNKPLHLIQVRNMIQTVLSSFSLCF